MHSENILESIDLKLMDEKYLTVSERYYTHKYCVKFSTKEANLDQCISFHSNRICLISLAENHPVMKNKKKIKNIDCMVGNVNRLANKSSGKGKRGAQKLKPDSVLCYIVCDDDTTYPVYSCIKGKLLEINENLLKDPELLIKKPRTEGYISLLLPYLDSFNSFKESMLSKEEYVEHCKQD